MKSVVAASPTTEVISPAWRYTGGSALTVTCEVCGSPVGPVPNRVEIDGAVLQVCGNCAKHGVRLSQPVRNTGPYRRPPAIRENLASPDLEVDPDYASIVREARQKMGITQEALGRAINVKTSVISLVESKKMKPDIVLARTLMHQLKVNLLVSSSELDSQSG